MATIAALTAVENKIPNVSNSVKKTDFKTNVSEIENKITTDHDDGKYITTQKVNKADFDNKLKTVNENVTSNKTIYLLAGNKLNELSKKVKAISTTKLTEYLIN